MIISINKINKIQNIIHTLFTPLQVIILLQFYFYPKITTNGTFFKSFVKHGRMK